jgi:hypothetical protein
MSNECLGEILQKKYCSNAPFVSLCDITEPHVRVFAYTSKCRCRLRARRACYFPNIGKQMLCSNISTNIFWNSILRHSSTWHYISPNFITETEKCAAAAGDCKAHRPIFCQHKFATFLYIFSFSFHSFSLQRSQP